MNLNADIDEVVHRMKSAGDSFAVATVVRTLSLTAAKPGAKAIINQDGDIVEGWIGGGCARRAVVKAAAESIADGEPRLLSIQPDEVLKDQGIPIGEEIDGRWVASNMCPSKGSMELFIEPFLVNPELIVVGTSPIATSLGKLAKLFDFNVSIVGYQDDVMNRDVANSYKQWADVAVEHSHRYIIVATQGAGDLNALDSALSVHSRHIGFVGSHRKMAHIKKRLKAQSHDAANLARIKGPTGLNIGSVTPQEIALSILAELVQLRRLGLTRSSSNISHTN